MSWDYAERDAIDQFILTQTAVRSALASFAARKRDQCQRETTAAMSTIPRKVEHAADWAAKAEVWDSLMREIENEFKRVTAGPTGK